MKLEDITLSKAYAIWKEASNYDEKVYEIMMYIIKKCDVRVLINRNPTLNYYSMLLMKIRKVKPDGEDYILSVPLSILPGLNADFDGDERFKMSPNSFNCWDISSRQSAAKTLYRVRFNDYRNQ